MKILLTGSAGFIGSHLGNRLVELGHDVTGVDNLSNPCVNLTRFPLVTERFEQFVEERPIDDYDAIVHLAAKINVDESIEHPQLYFRDNAQGTLILLEAARRVKYQGRIVYASSAEVYGSARTEVMGEDHPLDPLSPYAVSKLAAEQLCKNYAQLYGLDITVVRNFNTFGEFQSDGVYGGVIAKFKRQAREGGPITVYGSGEQMRDYMHVSQAVDGYVLALEQKMPLIVNFGSGMPVRIIDIANRIAQKFRVAIVHEKSRPGEIMRLRADIIRAQQYGYRATTDFWRQLDNFLEI